MLKQIRWIVVKGNSDAVKHIVDKISEEKARRKDSEPIPAHVSISLHPIQHPVEKHV